IGASRYRPVYSLLPSPWGIQWDLSSDGKCALSGSDDGFVRLWDLSTGQLRCRFLPQSHAVRCVALSPDDQFAAAGVERTREYRKDRNATLIWDTNHGKLLHALRGHEDMVLCVAFSTDGRRILSGSSDRTVRLWDVRTGTELRCFRGHADP